MVRYGKAWYGMVWYGMVWHVMTWYGTIWYGVVWYGMVWQAKQRLLACRLREEMIMRSIQGGWHADKHACARLHGGGHRSLPRPELARAVVLARADPAGASVAGGEG